MPADTDPGPSEARTDDRTVLSGRSEEERKKRKKKTESKSSDTPQILSLSLLVEAAVTFRPRPQSASWLLSTVWLPERICVFQCGLVESPSLSARPGSL